MKSKDDKTHTRLLLCKISIKQLLITYFLEKGDVHKGITGTLCLSLLSLKVKYIVFICCYCFCCC